MRSDFIFEDKLKIIKLVVMNWKLHIRSLIKHCRAWLNYYSDTYKTLFYLNSVSFIFSILYLNIRLSWKLCFFILFLYTGLCIGFVDLIFFLCFNFTKYVARSLMIFLYFLYVNLSWFHELNHEFNKLIWVIYRLDFFSISTFNTEYIRSRVSYFLIFYLYKFIMISRTES